MGIASEEKLIIFKRYPAVPYSFLKREDADEVGGWGFP